MIGIGVRSGREAPISFSSLVLFKKDGCRLGRKVLEQHSSLESLGAVPRIV
jgi:hypothetical protein